MQTSNTPNLIFSKLRINIKKISAFLILVGALFSLGQNCSDPRLVRDVQTFSSEGNFYVKLADITYTHRRYIFLVDMSHSMITGPCVGDVDGPPPLQKQATYGCPPLSSLAVGNVVSPNTYMGVDPLGVRIKAVMNWMQQLNQLSTSDINNVAVAVVPFSGGIRDAERRNRESGNGNLGKAAWRRYSQVSPYLTILQNEQAEDFARSADPKKWSDKYLGTSVPVPRVQEISELIRNDMIAQSNLGVLGTTAYQFIYLSDGVPSPTRDDLDRALALSGCSAPDAGFTCDAVSQTLKESWGDPDVNNMAAMKAALGNIMSLTKFYGEADLTFSLVVVRPDQIITSDKTITKNYLYGLKDSSSRYQFTQLESEAPPFQLKGLPRAFATYRVTAFHTYNTTTRINKDNSIDIDSDGDGLFDSEEGSLGTNPRNPRSDGVCLDIISVNPAYTGMCKSLSSALTSGSLNCDPKLDIDMDGINECEEQIIGSDPFGFDTDGDSIPDGLEVVYRNFALQDDSLLDSNSDNVSNLANFERGLLPQNYLVAAPPHGLVTIENQLNGMATFSIGNGRTIESEQLGVVLKNAPLSRAIDGVIVPELYTNRQHTAASRILPGEMIIKGSSASQSNDVTFLARVIDVDDTTQSRWLIFKAALSIGSATSNIAIDFSNMKMLRTIDYNNKPGHL